MTILRTLSATLLAALIGVGSAGCYGTTEVRGTAYTNSTASANLDYIGPDVQVVAESETPVFYSQSYYWQYNNGGWLRSRYHDRGFVTVNVVPEPVRRIDRPYAYVHYHHRGMANRRPVRVERY